MRRRVPRLLLALGCTALLGACAPVSFSPAGLTLGGIPGYGSTFSQCSALANASPEAARIGVRRGAIQAFARRNPIQQTQARLSSGYDVRNVRAGWKQIASGEC